MNKTRTQKTRRRRASKIKTRTGQKLVFTTIGRTMIHTISKLKTDTITGQSHTGRAAIGKADLEVLKAKFIAGQTVAILKRGSK